MIDITIVSLVLGFGVLAIARQTKGPLRGLYTFFAGILWVFSTIFVYPDYGAGWTIVALGFALLVLFEGALELMNYELG